ncbi:hypothetical protein [Azospirillum rugosum]|uniref:DUF3618 domain-containing protein n=1 Tax=Azospirillum rugosum TaxID=416170 RepID=A0ABS4SDL3_9PROT|nr:hypothetical protein [Azospirillum rugosum]MBP2290495.1 hypothetical protein [Azospirillum rugosum]MDQ0525383.1 hypothetical protein [Azospirillum rugosum]
MSGRADHGRERSSADQSRDYDALQRDIRESQSRITETIGALRHKAGQLAPRTVMENAMNRMHNTSNGGRGQRQEDRNYNQARSGQSRGWTSSVSSTVRDNPIPLALIGLGIGWLALSGSGYDRRIARSGAVHSVRDRAGSAAEYARDTFYSATGSVRDAASTAYDRASDLAGDAYDRASGAVSGARDHIPGMGGRTYSVGQSSQQTSASHSDGGRHGLMSTERMHSATSRLWDMVDEHPLVAGVMGVALGAALGASIPSTRYENEWIGDYADEATHRAKELAQEAMDRGTRAARAAVEAAKEEVGDAVTAAGDAAREEVRKPS